MDETRFTINACTNATTISDSSHPPLLLPDSDSRLPSSSPWSLLPFAFKSRLLSCLAASLFTLDRPCLLHVNSLSTSRDYFLFSIFFRSLLYLVKKSKRKSHKCLTKPRSTHCAKVCNSRSPPAKLWSNVLAIKRHNGLQTRGVSNESLRSIVSRWILSCFSKVLCIFIATRATYLPLHTRRLCA
jgi:hypothetical protein